MEINKKLRIMIIIILSLISSVSIVNCNKYNSEIVEIVALNEKNINSNNKEIILLNTDYKDEIKKYTIIEKKGEWFYRNGMLVNSGERPASIKLKLYPNEYNNINFVSNQNAGIIMVKHNNTEKRIDLYNKNYKDFVYGETVTTHRIQSEKNIIFSKKNIRAFLLYFIVFNLLYFFVFTICNRNIKYISILFIILLSILYFFEYTPFETDGISKMVIFSITLISSIFLKKQKYFDKKYMFLFILITFINAFIYSGQSLFLKSSEIKIGLQNISQFTMVSICLIPVELLFLRIISRIKIKSMKKTNKYMLLVFFTIIFGILLIELISFYPVNMTSDSVDQWLQGLQIRNISSSHPPIMAIFFRILSFLIPHPFVAGIMQILFISIVLSLLFYYLYKQGIKKIFVIIIIIVFCLCPNNYMLFTTLWKDVPYTIFLLILTILFYSILNNKDPFFNKVTNIILFTIILVLCYLYRYNGIGPLIFTLIFLIFYAKHIKSLNPIIVIILTVGLIMFIEGPIYTKFGVIKNKDEYNISYFNQLIQRSAGAILNNDNSNEISLGAKEILSRTIDYKLLKKYYNKYNNDTYVWNEEIGEYRLNNKSAGDVSTKDAITIYFEFLIKNPNSTIKERLDSSNLLWSIKTPSNGFNHKFVDGIYFPAEKDVKDEYFYVNRDSNTNKWYNNYNIAVPFRKIRNLSEKYQIFDIIFWRVGIAWFVIIICTFYLLMNKKKNILVLIPMLGNTATWIVLMAHQSYRYVYYIFIISVFYLLLTILSNKNEESIK